VANNKDYWDCQRREDIIIQASQGELFQEENISEPENYDFEEYLPMLRREIKDPNFLESFEQAMNSEQVTGKSKTHLSTSRNSQK
jgi:hypothetical protein